MNKTGGGFIHRKRQGVLLTCSSAFASLARCHIVDKKGNKNVYGQATSFLNCFSPFSKECDLFTNHSQSNHSTKFLNDLFGLFLCLFTDHWNMLASLTPSHILILLFYSICCLPWFYQPACCSEPSRDAFVLSATDRQGQSSPA